MIWVPITFLALTFIGGLVDGSPGAAFGALGIIVSFLSGISEGREVGREEAKRV